MADELHLALSSEEHERLAAAAAARAQTPEQYARDLVTEGIDGRFTRSLTAVRSELPALLARENGEASQVHADLPADELPMSSRDLRSDRSAA